MKQYIKDFLERQIAKRLCFLIRKYINNSGLSTIEFVAKLDSMPDGLILYASIKLSIEIYCYDIGKSYSIVYCPLSTNEENRLIGYFEFVDDSNMYGTCARGNTLKELLKDLFLLMTL